jgi:putative ABC transport system permease protein
MRCANAALRASRVWVRLVSLVVPRDRRAEWREEWESELWHEARHGASHEFTGGVRGAAAETSALARLLARASGALPHALAIRVADWSLVGLAGDVRWAVLSVRRRAGFALMTAMLLGLGIGGTVALFSSVNAVLLRALPFEEAGRLLWVNGEFSGGDRASVSPPDFLDYRDASHSFAAMSAMLSYPTAATLNGDVPEEVRATVVTSNFFRTLGVRPAGRAFTLEEEVATTSDVVMMSESLWRRRYGSDARYPGGTIELDGRAATVIGIVPAGRGFPAGVDIWRPLARGGDDFQMRGAHFLRPILRLADGVTLAQGQAEVDVIAARLESMYPQSNTSWRLRLIPLRAALAGDVRAPLLALLGAAVLVLLIACANVSGLMLARAGERQAELAVRAALGATRARVFRQLLIESIVIALMAGASGVVIASWLQRVVTQWSELSPPGTVARLDARVLGFAAALSAAVGLLSGILPAWRLAGGRLSLLVKDAIRTRDRSGDGARNAMIVVEVALAVMLVSSAVLFLRSFARLRSVDPGFSTRHAVVASLRFPAGRYADEAAVMRGLDAMVERLAAVPGVTAVGAINALPSVEFSGDTRLYPASRPPADPNQWRTAQIRFVSEGYFDALRIPLLEGRVNDVGDGPAGRPVLLINADLRDRFFAGESPIGQILMVGVGTPQPVEVIGVVGSVRQVGLGSPPQAEMYMPVRQVEYAVKRLTVVVRSAPGRDIELAAVRDAIRGVDPDQPIPMLTRLDDAIAGTVAEPRFRAGLLTAFAGFALLLAGLGLYALLAFIVSRGTREIGIRMALGARAGAVVTAVVARGLAMAGTGLVIGIAASTAIARLLRGLLYDIAPLDPLSLIITVALIAVITFLASLRPAVRAVRIDPAISLRNP